MSRILECRCTFGCLNIISRMAKQLSIFQQAFVTTKMILPLYRYTDIQIETNSKIILTINNNNLKRERRP